MASTRLKSWGCLSPYIMSFSLSLSLVEGPRCLVYNSSCLQRSLKRVSQVAFPLLNLLPNSLRCIGCPTCSYSRSATSSSSHLPQSMLDSTGGPTGGRARREDGLFVGTGREAGNVSSILGGRSHDYSLRRSLAAVEFGDAVRTVSMKRTKLDDGGGTGRITHEMNVYVGNKGQVLTRPAFLGREWAAFGSEAENDRVELGSGSNDRSCRHSVVFTPLTGSAGAGVEIPMKEAVVDVQWLSPRAVVAASGSSLHLCPIPDEIETSMLEQGRRITGKLLLPTAYLFPHQQWKKKRACCCSAKALSARRRKG
ncbi:unnamed protein product [Choristocarpus tenellus]